MGYSEIQCQICGMSFNIGRIRTTTESRSAGWDCFGYSMGGFLSCSEQSCPPESGCMAVLRYPRDRPPDRERYPSVENLQSQAAIEDDGDFEYQSPQEDDPLEYDSSCQSSSGGSVVGDDDLPGPQPAPSPETYAAFVHSISSSSEGLEQLIPQSEVPVSDLSSYEHVAGGLNCRYNTHNLETGFNGHAISDDEMRGCNTFQCFVRKNLNWSAAPDDQEFEKEGDFFLSGLSDYAPSRDVDNPKFSPVRHGCEVLRADNQFFEAETANELAMPFHPTCLEVFKRASLLRTGAIDYDGLINWWILEGNYDTFGTFPRDPAVNTSQWFNHIPGNEFVASNPCFVRGLPEILASSDRSSDTDFNFSTGAFADTMPTTTSSEFFSKLPQELRLMILKHLGSKDIANLRLVSRNFRQLSQVFFRELTLREMPWLWEAWSTMEYSIWANTKASDLKKNEHQYVERMAGIRQALHVLAEEARESGDENEHQAAMYALEHLRADETSRNRPIPSPAPLLAAQKTDWYHLRTQIARNNSRLLGLRNRRRIWKDCEEILSRINQYRDMGKIMPGEMVDARAMAEAATERRRQKIIRWHKYCAAGRPGEYRFEDWA